MTPSRSTAFFLSIPPSLLLILLLHSYWSADSLSLGLKSTHYFNLQLANGTLLLEHFHLSPTPHPFRNGWDHISFDPILLTITIRTRYAGIPFAGFSSNSSPLAGVPVTTNSALWFPLWLPALLSALPLTFLLRHRLSSRHTGFPISPPTDPPSMPSSPPPPPDDAHPPPYNPTPPSNTDST